MWGLCMCDVVFSDGKNFFYAIIISPLRGLAGGWPLSIVLTVEWICWVVMNIRELSRQICCVILVLFHHHMARLFSTLA